MSVMRVVIVNRTTKVNLAIRKMSQVWTDNGSWITDVPFKGECLMIIHMSKNATQQQLQAVNDRITSRELNFDISNGITGVTVIGVLGDCSKLRKCLRGN